MKHIKNKKNSLARAKNNSDYSLYNYVYEQLTNLIPKYNLKDSQNKIFQAYNIICKESLAIPYGRKPPYFSRINVDGTPFQYSLQLGTHKPALQFLSEVGILGSSNIDRLMLSKKRIYTLSVLFCTENILSEVNDLLDKIVPANNPVLLTQNSGMYWIGVSFSPREKPKMKIYINGKWGTEKEMWDRLDLFISYINGSDEWFEAKKTLISGMKPLGMALTLKEDKQPSGRIYLSAYGNQLEFYEHYIRSITNDWEFNLFKQYTEIILGKERLYPTKSVVCSFGFDSRASLDFKFEMCGHCIFPNDADASNRCLDWLESIEVDPVEYIYLLKLLSENQLSKTEVDLHSFIGFGLKDYEVYSSFYLKPSILRFNERK